MGQQHVEKEVKSIDSTDSLKEEKKANGKDETTDLVQEMEKKLDISSEDNPDLSKDKEKAGNVEDEKKSNDTSNSTSSTSPENNNSADNLTYLFTEMKAIYKKNLEQEGGMIRLVYPGALLTIQNKSKTNAIGVQCMTNLLKACENIVKKNIEVPYLLSREWRKKNKKDDESESKGGRVTWNRGGGRGEGIVGGRGGR